MPKLNYLKVKHGRQSVCHFEIANLFTAPRISGLLRGHNANGSPPESVMKSGGIRLWLRLAGGQQTLLISVAFFLGALIKAKPLPASFGSRYAIWMGFMLVWRPFWVFLFFFCMVVVFCECAVFSFSVANLLLNSDSRAPRPCRR